MSDTLDMRTWVFAFLLVVPAFCADWNPRLAATYLDAREKAWAEWPTAAASGGTCFSCHTQMTYLLARPSLRRAFGENQPTVYEEALLNGLRARVTASEAKEIFPSFAKEPLASESMGVESIFAALFLSSDQAFSRMWSLQIKDGKSKGAWAWFELYLDPWETADSPFYGASLAALAVGSTPPESRDHEHIAALVEYLKTHYSSQPLHNRLMLLWASTKLPAALPESARRPLIERSFQPPGTRRRLDHRLSGCLGRASAELRTQSEPTATRPPS